MGKRVASLLLDLQARTAKFRKGMQSAEKRLAKFRTAVGTAAKRLAKFSAAAVAAGVAIAGAIIVKGARAVVEMNRMADRLGITTQALSELTFAARQLGISQEELADSMKDLSEKIAEAAVNGGGYEETLNRMGLKGKELVGVPLEQKFMRVMEGLRRLPTQSEKVAAAMELMSDNGFRLVTMADAGADKLNAMRQQARDLGIAVSGVEAEKLEEATRKLDRFMQQVTMTGAKIGAQLITPFTEFIRLIAGGLSFTSGINGVKDFGTVAIAVLGTLGNAINNLRRAMLRLEASTKLAGAAWSALHFDLEGVEKKLDKADRLMIEEGMIALRDFTQELSSAVHLAEAKLRADKASADANKEQTRELEKQVALQADARPQRALGRADRAGGGRSGSLEDFLALRGLAPLEGGENLLQAELDAMAQEDPFARVTDNMRAGLDEIDALLDQHEQQLADAQGQYTDAALRRQNIFTAAQMRGQQQLTEQEQWHWSQRATFALGQIELLTRGAAQHNKTMFQINKAAGIANATVSTAEAITKTLAAYPYPFNIGMASLVGAAGAVQIQAIAQTSFTGAGGSAPSVAGSGGGMPTDTGPNQGTPGALNRQRGVEQTLIVQTRGRRSVPTEDLVEVFEEARERGITFPRIIFQD